MNLVEDLLKQINLFLPVIALREPSPESHQPRSLSKGLLVNYWVLHVDLDRCIISVSIFMVASTLFTHLIVSLVQEVKTFIKTELRLAGGQAGWAHHRAYIVRVERITAILQHHGVRGLLFLISKHHIIILKPLLCTGLVELLME